jgi:hypothetical protein
MLDCRSTIAAVGAFVGALLAGCGDPDLPTDLRTSGPPNVTAVTVMSDLETSIDPSSEKTGGLDRLLEDATYCRIGDDKRPGLVGLPDIRTIQVCPDDLGAKAMDDGVAPGAPPVWFVRVVFDKLLDASIEDLVPSPDGNGTVGSLKNTQPVALQCDGVDIAYDGYYVPNGNKQSWPLGPALFIQPLSPTDAPTGASCTVSLRDIIHNKAGQSVPTDQRDYKFVLAPMSFRFSDPEPDDKNDGSIVVSPTTPVNLFWTAELKAGATITTVTGSGSKSITLSDLDPTKISLRSAPNMGITSTNPDGDPDPSVCQGGGTAVDPGQIRAYLLGPNATTAALVLSIDAGGNAVTPTAQMDQLWQPTTTYLLTFSDGAAVTPKQGGDPGALPGASDFSLCFHTTN